MKVRANGLSLPDLDTLAALETGRYWTPAKRPGEALYRPAVNNGYWAEDIITDGLVLYVPMWLYSGAKFPSVDAYKHTCTVTGATWGLQGRLFNGTSDLIVTGDNIGISGAADKSAIVWVKLLNAVNAWNDFLGWGAGSLTNMFSMGSADASAPNYSFYISQYGNSVRGTFTPTLNQWYCVGATAVGTAYILYINDAQENTGTMATNVTDSPVKLGTFASYCNCVIGEALVYNRALSLAEITHIYNATRWRYA
jgi:hypothetical protein